MGKLVLRVCWLDIVLERWCCFLGSSYHVLCYVRASIGKQDMLSGSWICWTLICSKRVTLFSWVGRMRRSCCAGALCGHSTCYCACHLLLSFGFPMHHNANMRHRIKISGVLSVAHPPCATERQNGCAIDSHFPTIAVFYWSSKSFVSYEVPLRRQTKKG